MKRLALILLALLAFSTLSQSQTWENFWHPRPLAAKTIKSKNATTIIVGGSILEFKPTGELAVTQYRPGTNGNSGVATFLDAFGPALTLQHSSQDAAGVNYADWSLNLSALLTGNTSSAPVFTPEAAFTIGCLNNLLQGGIGYDLAPRMDNYSRWSIHFLVGVNITNN